jgi:Domain of unknown function (DUF4292)
MPMTHRLLHGLYAPMLIGFLVIGLSSCSKKIVPVTTPPVAKTVDVEEIDFGYMHGKARMVYKDEKKERDVKANIRVRKDSVIWLSFSVVGFQGGRALINKDSITIVSTVDREYYVYDYADLTKRFKFEVNYKVLEAAFLGNLIQNKSATDVVSQDGVFDVLSQGQGEVRIKNAINRTTKKIEKVDLIDPGSGNALHIEYGNFQPLGDRTYAYNSTINVVYKTLTTVLNNSITVEFNKAEVGDKELKFPFKIPAKYDRR